MEEKCWLYICGFSPIRKEWLCGAVVQLFKNKTKSIAPNRDLCMYSSFAVYFYVHFQIPCMIHTGDCDHSPQFYLIVQHRNHQFHSGLCSSCMYESTDSWLLRFQQLNLFYKTLITSDLNISATVQWVLIVVACGGKHWADSCLLAVGAGAALLGFCMVQFFIACLNGTPLFQRLETYFC